jgi:hypothetical protein
MPVVPEPPPLDEPEAEPEPESLVSTLPLALSDVGPKVVEPA